MSPHATRSGVRAIGRGADGDSSAAQPPSQPAPVSTARGRGGMPIGRLCLLAAGLGIAYALFIQAAFWFMSPLGGAAFFPAAGLAVSVLVVTPRRARAVGLAALATGPAAPFPLHRQP